MKTDKYDKLGNILIAYGIITPEQLAVLLHEQKYLKVLLGDILQLKNAINKDQLKQALIIQGKLRSKNKRTQTLALADLAIKAYNRQRIIEKRNELRKKADKISNEYPIYFRKKG